MRYLVTIVAFFILLIIGTGQISTIQAQTHTVNYNIPDWNASGSFAFETGTGLNKVTNKEEGYIKITWQLPDGNNKIIEINPEKIDLMIQRLKVSSVLKTNKMSKMSNVENSKKELVVNKLESLKALLKDPEKIKQLSAKLKKNKGVTSLNWDYTVETIRNIQAQVTGTVD